jgi:hypothetical protein
MFDGSGAARRGIIDNFTIQTQSMLRYAAVFSSTGRRYSAEYAFG